MQVSYKYRPNDPIRKMNKFTRIHVDLHEINKRNDKYGWSKTKQLLTC